MTAHEQMIRTALTFTDADSERYALAALDALVAERDALRDRAVCSGCGQDVDEGGACHTEGCDDGEMIPASDLPGALNLMRENFAAERAEWRFDWEALRAEAKQVAADRDAAVEVLRSAAWLLEFLTPDQRASFECGHGATVNMACPAKCEAHRRMVAVDDVLARLGETP